VVGHLPVLAADDLEVGPEGAIEEATEAHVVRGAWEEERPSSAMAPGILSVECGLEELAHAV
jgi:hypothetical protein